MNITYIIGNGFDFNLGLKTSYKSFLDYYLKRDSGDRIIELFKDSIKQCNDLWSDVEIALGQSTDLFIEEDNPLWHQRLVSDYSDLDIYVHTSLLDHTECKK